MGEINKIKAKVQVLEQNPSGSSAVRETNVATELKQLRATIDKFDVAHRRVSFFGWAEHTSASDRLKAMETLMAQKLPDSKPINYDNDYKGPYNQRVLGKTAFVALASSDAVRTVLK